VVFNLMLQGFTDMRRRPKVQQAGAGGARDAKVI
jgi:hypothetical protein